MDGKSSMKGAWLGHVNHLNFGGHQPYLWYGCRQSCQVNRLRCCKLRWTVSVINWWRSSVTILSYWPPTIVYNTVGVMHRVAWVCQRQRRLVMHRRRSYHRLRDSASPVLTATGFVTGKGQFSTPTESTPLNRSPKNLSQVITSATPTAVPN